MRLIEDLVNLAVGVVGEEVRLQDPYRVPRLRTSTSWVQSDVRVEVARDVRAKFYVVRKVFYPSGTVKDDPVPCEVPLSPLDPLATPIMLTWQGVLPDGCSWDASLTDQFGNVLDATDDFTGGPLTVLGPDGHRAYKAFTPTAGSVDPVLGGTKQGILSCQVTFSMTTDSTQFKTPVISGFQIMQTANYSSGNPLSTVTVPARVTPSGSPSTETSDYLEYVADGQLEFPLTGEANTNLVDTGSSFTYTEDAVLADKGALPQTTISSVDVMPQQMDAGSEDATIVVEDLTGALEFLDSSQLRPIKLTTTYPSGQPQPPGSTGTDPAVLFQGYVKRADRRRARGDGYQMDGTTVKDYPSQNRSTWTLSCVGEWLRFYEATFPQKWSWSLPTNPLYANRVPYVHEVIYAVLEMVYPASMIDIPSSVPPIPLFTTNPDQMTVQPGQRISDFVTQLAHDYLGAYLIWDESAGTNGMMRLRLQKVAPYTNLANFTMDHATKVHGDSIPRLPHALSSYPTAVSGSQNTPTVYIKAGTLVTHREPSEGNAVIMFGAAVGSDMAQSGSQGASMFVQVALKTDSCNFFGLAPGNPNYPDGSSPEFYNRVVPIRAYDPTLSSQFGVDFKCRRIFDHACWSQYYIAFEAPLVLVADSTDMLQTVPRRLKYYDAVTCQAYDGSTLQCVVVSCQPSYKKDGMQMARYVLLTQGNINQRIATYKTSAQVLRRLQSRLLGEAEPHGSSATSRANEMKIAKTAWMGLPALSGNPIQDLDPTSSTFGQFYFLANYDAPDSGVVR